MPRVPHRSAADLASAFASVAIEVGAPDPGGFDVVVDCTPLGMAASPGLPFDTGRLAPGTLVVDLNFGPEITGLL